MKKLNLCENLKIEKIKIMIDPDCARCRRCNKLYYTDELLDGVCVPCEYHHPFGDETIKYTKDELIQLCAAIEKLNKMDKRFLVDYGYGNAVEIANSLETAAQCWCKPSTSDSEMDANLAIEFAKKLDELKELHTQQLEVILEDSKKINLKCLEVVKNYHELIYAVGKKYPNESRHETALRYIITSEKEDITNYTDVRKP